MKMDVVTLMQMMLLLPMAIALRRKNMRRDHLSLLSLVKMVSMKMRS